MLEKKLNIIIILFYAGKNPNNNRLFDLRNKTVVMMNFGC